MSLYTSHHAAANLLRDLFEAFVRLYVRPRVSGAEHLPTSGAWILASNHASHADTAVIYSAVPRQMQQRLLAAAAQDYSSRAGRASAPPASSSTPSPSSASRRGGATRCAT